MANVTINTPRLRTSLIAASVTLFVSSWTSHAVAQRQTPSNQLAVDVVRLRSGEKLRGAVLNETASGTLTMAVQRKWLRDAYPDYFQSVAADEAARQESIASDLNRRITLWIADVESRPRQRPEFRQLLAFLKDQQQQIEQRLSVLEGRRDTAFDSQFLLLDQARKLVASKVIQSAERRRIAMLAWQERFREVETLSAEQLRNSLEARNINLDPQADPVDLSDRVPPAAQTDEEWATRQALVEFQLVQPLEFQGTGGAMFRTDGAAPQVDLAALLPQLLQSQLTSQLGDLLEEPGLGGARQRDGRRPQRSSIESLRPSIREAEQLGLRGFRVTQLDLNLSQARATVTEQFVARMPGGDWKIVWTDTVREDARQARPGTEEQIANDPQVKQLLQLAEQLGGAGSQVKTAVRFGAATQAAQQKARARFYDFRDRHTQRLDGPPLAVTESR